MAFQMTDSQQVTMTVAFADRRGNPTPPPAARSRRRGWSTTRPSCRCAGGGRHVVRGGALGPLGVGTVSVSVADASGNPLASGSVAVTIAGVRRPS